MALGKLGFNIPFGQGVDTKTDPNQVQPGKMLELVNAVFNKGQLQKRGGFSSLTVLPDTLQTTLTTFSDSLIATGSSLLAYSSDSDEWLSQGTVQPVQLSVQSLNRNSGSQSAVDLAVTSTGLCCLVYVEDSVAYYQISRADTGQAVVAPTALPSTATDPRVYALSRQFIITFKATVTATPHLQFIAVPFNNPTNPGSATDISTQVNTTAAAYDAVVANGSLYVSWDASDLGGAIRTAYVSSTLAVSSSVSEASVNADLLSICADTSSTNPTIRVTWWETTGNTTNTMSYAANLVQTVAPVEIVMSSETVQLASISTDGVMSVYYEVDNEYSYDTIRTDYINKVTVQADGTVDSDDTIIRSVGIASKPFTVQDTDYILTTYGDATSYQPTYFLINSDGDIIAKLAYSNGGGYITSQVLPNVSLVDEVAYIPYLIKDLLASVSKEVSETQQNIYTQTGVNLARFEINTSEQYSTEIAASLNLTGGILWQYDGIAPVEQGFNLWPEHIDVSTDTSGGSISAQEYFYVFTYEWTDAQGLLHRSAPSVPASITTTGATSTNTIEVPTLRLTYKAGNNPVRIVGYRWSQAQQNFYQFTSIATPVLNDLTVDSVEITDTAADSAILGNTLLYTTGGVVENIAPPANAGLTEFGDRMVLIDAEDRNLIWFSKPVLENTPVEFSDLFTKYIPPTAGAQGSTGDLTALFEMDDKLILFKRSAIYYMVGNGPDITGANNDYSRPVFITGTVGCSNPKSLVMTPNGLLFQSDKGIWMLGRNLSTTYIGAPVEAFNNYTVVGALSIPATNEVRISLSNGVVLLYDYYYDQWGWFEGVPSISSTLFQSKHTYLNSLGQVKQQSSNTYLDGSSPVLMRFSTAWLKLSDLQGYQRSFFFYFLGKYLSPHKLQIDIAYDFDPSIQQSIIYTPDNYSPAWGGEANWGSGEVYGGPSSVEQLRVFLERQRCQAIRITVTEIFDSSLGVDAGAGFTMSGINLVAAVKKGYPVLPASQSVG